MADLVLEVVVGFGGDLDEAVVVKGAALVIGKKGCNNMRAVLLYAILVIAG
jgi:hypothetical protein